VHPDRLQSAVPCQEEYTCCVRKCVPCEGHPLRDEVRPGVREGQVLLPHGLQDGGEGSRLRHLRQPLRHRLRQRLRQQLWLILLRQRPRAVRRPLQQGPWQLWLQRSQLRQRLLQVRFVK